LRQKVANYPGVTVEQHQGVARTPSGGEVTLIDLPGIYSLTPQSEDERVSFDVLHGKMPYCGRPDAVLVVIDSTNLARHLTLVAPILALGLPAMLVLNMADDLRARGGEVDAKALSLEIGAPVVLASASRGEGLDAILEFLDRYAFHSAPACAPELDDYPQCRAWAARVSRRAAYEPPAQPELTRKLDRIFLHAFWGPAIFLVVVLAVFQGMFTLARPLMDAVQAAIAGSGGLIARVLPDGAWKSLVVDGIWSGVGSVLVFLPQILILFLFIGILEDSGYLARAALIADRTMARVGLQGKSFIPLLSAYACAVPGIMAARTIENKRDRIATILIAPFMTCSARLPVYTLVIAAFIPERPLLGPLLGTRAAALLGLYVLGFVAAFATAGVLKSSILKSERAPFVLEIPPYRRPTLRALGVRLLDRAKVFLRRAGTVILLATVVLWGIAHVPLQNGHVPPISDSLAGTIGRTIEPAIKPLGFNWKIGVGLVSTLAAREVIISTLGAIHGIQEGANAAGLHAALRQDLTPAGGVALLVFFAFAMQCISTITAVWRETGSWKWPALQFGYMGALAYSGAFVAYRLAGLWLG